MQSDNLIVIASAGSGKTTTAVRTACEDQTSRTALITYTLNGQEELRKRAIRTYGSIPSNVKIYTWYSFVMGHLVRPYQNHLHERRVDTINFERPGIARRRFKKTDAGFYFSTPNRLWSDRVTDFACRLIEETDALPLKRLEALFDRIVIDEAQDLAGWDLEIVRYLLDSSTEVVLVGDHRQATFATNNNPKNSKYRGESIIELFTKWHEEGLSEIKFDCISHRCVALICAFADTFFPELPPTTSLNKTETDHDGLFIVRAKDAQRYFETFAPQTLQWSKTGSARLGNPLNFGEAKGMTFKRVMIYPHANLLKYLQTGTMELHGESKTKSYVAVTRARHSVAIVVPDSFKPAIHNFYELK